MLVLGNEYLVFLIYRTVVPLLKDHSVVHTDGGL